MITCFQYLDDEAYKLKVGLEQRGWFFDSIVDLVDLYETFSEEKYCAGFMMVNDGMIEEFIEWIKETKITVHYVC